MIDIYFSTYGMVTFVHFISPFKCKRCFSRFRESTITFKIVTIYNATTKEIAIFFAFFRRFITKKYKFHYALQ